MHHNVIHPRQRIGAFQPKRRQADRVGAGIGKNIGRILVGADFSIAKVPTVSQRTGAQIGEPNRQRRDAVGRPGDKTGHGRGWRIGHDDVTEQRQRIAAAGTKRGEADRIRAGIGISMDRAGAAVAGAIAKIPGVAVGTGAEVGEVDGERNDSAGGLGDKIRDDGRRRVGHHDVIGASQSIAATQAGRRQGDRVDPDVGVGMGRVLVGAPVAIAKIPTVIGRAAAQVGEGHCQRR